MKNNMLPALIIAVALLVAALAPRPGASDKIQETLKALEEVANTKDAEGKSQIERIAAGFSKSAAQGMKFGFGMDDPKADKEILAVIEKLEIREVKIVKSQFKGKERVIGLLKNGSDKIIKEVQLNVVYKAADGALLDVSSSFSRVSGPVKPGDEVGFEVDRTLGEFTAKDEELAQNRAASAVVKILTLKLVE